MGSLSDGHFILLSRSRGAQVRAPADRVQVGRWPFPCCVHSSYRRLIPAPPEGPAPHTGGGAGAGLSRQQAGLSPLHWPTILLGPLKRGQKKGGYFRWYKNLPEVFFHLVWFVQWTFLVSLLGLKSSFWCCHLPSQNEAEQETEQYDTTTTTRTTTRLGRPWKPRERGGRTPPDSPRGLAGVLLPRGVWMSRQASPMKAAPSSCFRRSVCGGRQRPHPDPLPSVPSQGPPQPPETAGKGFL